MAWFLGIDIGSETSKGVILKNGDPVAVYVIPSGFDYKKTAEGIKEALLKEAGISFEDISYLAATGQGDMSVSFAHSRVDDIRCTARGIQSMFPTVRTIIDVCSQSSRIIRITPVGQVKDFVISEKCAAGSGQFLHIIANVLRVELEEIGELSLKSRNPVQFTTGCAVFWETEAISRVSEGFLKEDILAGVHKSLAGKIASLIDRVGLELDCAISGGGGHDSGLIRSIESELGITLKVPPQPQIIAALGAAVMAAELYKEGG
jgi:predicted CoA-substrate-specific enzyme activase